MIVGRICRRVVASASPQETIRVAAERMAANDVGTLVVLESAGAAKPAGIVTDRDIVIRCVAAGLDPEHNLVGEVMTRPVHCVDEQTPVEEALQRMAKAGTRRLVVLGEGRRLVGVLSLDDLLDLLADEAGSISQLLARQQSHISPAGAGR
jgi:CBS domain-containing protein